MLHRVEESPLVALLGLSQRLAIVHPPIYDMLQNTFALLRIFDVANFFGPCCIDFFAKVEVVHCADNQLVKTEKMQSTYISCRSGSVWRTIVDKH